MRYPLDELLDKRSIIKLKIERIEQTPDREKECMDYWIAVLDYVKEGTCSMPQVEGWCQELRDINSKIWDLEADIRKGKEGELGFEEVGRRALQIRDLNAVRVGIKSKIVAKTGIGYKDVKKDHASEVGKQ